MNIVMMTNTFTPHRGGVARSVESFTAAYRERGERVLVVAPEFDDAPEHEEDVVRVPAVQHFNGSDFSVMLPIPGLLHRTLDDFEPDIVHSHHPFLLGGTAIRVARNRGLPLVFTHHTMYEHYAHYVPGDSPLLRRFVVELTTSYANLCDHVIAPSESTATVLRERGITTPITVIPTGIRLDIFAAGDGPACRRRLGIPKTAFVVGHVGRLALEKNLRFLAQSIGLFLDANENSHFLLAGEGEEAAEIRRIITAVGTLDRLHCLGGLDKAALADTYRAMNVFAFSSHSETQGMVLAEAMAAGVPVVALDAPGVREVVTDGVNGRLLRDEDCQAFADALQSIADASAAQRQSLTEGIAATAHRFSIGQTAANAVQVYERLIGESAQDRERAHDRWIAITRLVEAEWDLVVGLADAAGTALVQTMRESGES